MTDKQEDELFRMGIFNICESLHGSLTGISDHLHPAREDDLIEYLKYRLANWDRRSGGKHLLYDEAVRHLVMCTLAERGIAP